MKIAVYVDYTSSNSQALTVAMSKGFKANGAVVNYIEDTHYQSDDPDFYDGAIVYGYKHRHQAILAGYKKAMKFCVLIDAGYFKRDKYYKCTINDRHPNAYIMNGTYPKHRLESFGGVEITPWQKNKDGHILVAGISDKAAADYNLDPYEWEREAIRLLRDYTKRKIVYRPKPNFRGSENQVGADEFAKKGSIEQYLSGAWALVTRHGNSSIDAVCAGVPCLAEDGAGVFLGYSDFTKIESPFYPSSDYVYDVLCKLAYCQFTANEMASGFAFDVLMRQFYDLQ